MCISCSSKHQLWKLSLWININWASNVKDTANLKAYRRVHSCWGSSQTSQGTPQAQAQQESIETEKYHDCSWSSILLLECLYSNLVIISPEAKFWHHVFCWGDPNSGGDSRIFDDLFVDVKKILGRSDGHGAPRGIFGYWVSQVGGFRTRRGPESIMASWKLMCFSREKHQITFICWFFFPLPCLSTRVSELRLAMDGICTSKLFQRSINVRLAMSVDSRHIQIYGSHTTRKYQGFMGAKHEQTSGFNDVSNPIYYCDAFILCSVVYLLL